MRDLSRLGSVPVSRRGALASLAAAGLSSFVAGCGVSEYETRMEESLDELSLQNRFVNLRPDALTLNDPDSGLGITVTMRLPKMLFPNPNAPPIFLRNKSPKPENVNEDMPDDRLKPPAPLPAIPGYQTSIESYVPSSVGFRACYFYAGIEKVDPAMPAKARRDALEKSLQASLTAGNQTDAAQQATWREVQVTTPNPGEAARKFYQLEVNCRQLFEVRGNVANEVIGAYMLLAYETNSRETPGYQIFLGWRIPAAAFARQSYLDSAIAAAGTLMVSANKSAAPAAAAS